MTRYGAKRIVGLVIGSLLSLGLMAQLTLAQEGGSGDPKLVDAGSVANPNTRAIPVEDISEAAVQAAALLETLTSIQGTGEALRDLRSRIDRLLGDVDIDLTSIQIALSSTPTVQSMGEWKADLRSLLVSLRAIDQQLDQRLDELRAALDQVEANTAEWRETSNAVASIEISIAIRERIDTTLSAFVEAQDGLIRRRDEVLGLRDLLVEPLAELDRTFRQLDAKIQSRLSGLFSRERSALWSGDLFQSIGDEVSDGGLEAVQRRVGRTYDYFKANISTLALQVVVFIALAIGLRLLGSRAEDLADENYDLRTATLVFANPAAMAMVIALALTSLLHPNAPSLFYMLALALGVIAASLIVNGLLSSANRPVVWALVVVFIVDLVRGYLDTLPMLERAIFLAEILGAIAFLFWLRQPRRLESVSAEQRSDALFRVTRRLTGIAIALLLTTLVAEVVGLGDLADLVGSGTFRSAYTALGIYALLNILRSLMAFALVLWPISLLKSVSGNRSGVRRWIEKYLGWGALAAWVFFTLDYFGLAAPVVSSLTLLINAEANIGSLSVSLGGILVLIVTIWASFALARFINHILSEEVYERVTLPRGMPYAISTLTRYTVIVLGFLIALAAAGIELSKVAIVAGGLSVGIGFGLQTVVSNFVSGLILLFERPLKVGDDIQLGGLSGEIRRIGIRASSLRTYEGAEVILPNSKLISEAVTNWTFKDRRRRIEVNLKLGASIDADQVVKALLDVANAHPSLLPHPAPRASLIRFDISGLEFVLRAWISEFRDEVAVRSELNGAIQRKFAEAGIIEPLRGLSASRDSVAAK